MKTIIVIILIMRFIATSYSQLPNNPPVNLKTDYMEKSMHQRHAAKVMLWCGLVLAITGEIISSNNNYIKTGWLSVRNNKKYDPTGNIISFTGIASMLGSIPLFMAKNRNKKKALSLSYKNEISQQLSKQSFVSRPVPSLTLKISL